MQYNFRDKNDPELQIWTKNWDREMERKREEEKRASEDAERLLMESRDRVTPVIKSEPVDSKGQSGAVMYVSCKIHRGQIAFIFCFTLYKCQIHFSESGAGKRHVAASS